MMIAQSHSILFDVESRQIDPESGERERAWLIPNLLDLKDRTFDDWVNVGPVEVVHYGRFLAERVFLQFMGEYRHCIRSISREAFRDEVIFTEPQTGARALIRPDYESAEHSIGIWADPEDKTGRVSDWCLTIKSWLTGAVDLRTRSHAPLRREGRADNSNFSSSPIQTGGISRPQLQSRAERFVQAYFFPKPQYLLAWILGCAESTLTTIIDGDPPGLPPSAILRQAREKASSAKWITPGRAKATIDTGLGNTLRANVVDPKEKVILEEELGRLAHMAKGRLIEELIKSETNEKKRAECRRRANQFPDHDLRMLLAKRRIAAE